MFTGAATVRLNGINGSRSCAVLPYCLRLEALILEQLHLDGQDSAA